MKRVVLVGSKSEGCGMPAETVCAVVVEFFFAVARLTRTARLEMKCPCALEGLENSAERCASMLHYCKKSRHLRQPSFAAQDTLFAKTVHGP